MKTSCIGDASKHYPNDLDNPRNFVDYENTKYDRFVKPYDEVKPQVTTISSIEDYKKTKLESLQAEKSNFVANGIDVSSKI